MNIQESVVFDFIDVSIEEYMEDPGTQVLGLRDHFKTTV